MINPHYGNIPPSYLFSEVAARVSAYQDAHPDERVLRLGIGDVTRPLAPAVVDALHDAVAEQASGESFRGYGPEQGYAFLRDAIVAGEYAPIGTAIAADEIFVGDGSKTDTAGVQELFAADATIAVSDPVYPVYVDSNALAGRLGEFVDGRWEQLTYLECTAENGYVPALPEAPVDLVYLCSPNNPTGTSLSRADLERWVAWARENNAIILFDVAYRAFVTDPTVPRSIYEIEGADEVAIEFGSFSKTAGFTGLRCSWTVVPKALTRDGASLHAMWSRRHATKFNGTPYIVQRGAEAVYSEAGREQVQADIDYYLRNAGLIRDALRGAGIDTVGGVDSPYVWFRCPAGLDSWAFFDVLLNEAQVVGTPGVGFGPAGEDHFRLSAFGTYEDTLEAVARISSLVPTLHSTTLIRSES
ncbi:LL-diaminopimelate aminotransferase [Gulosibacter molinativorax]|uniref:LL-diaminopimelate aminotransferase n=1 Tax=Gulosibacter molinativorax TaxID=256821 RepID=A0ABT7C4T2_9MICO|nr:LL-diaminopimelate aminotransferase [Gulosibacter molinativorax]MDJ1369779.1 LL-diaminopimelate aminotransferase [Gulosibacter molinativorax]QUY61744.1 LL-diaminopimelate aminotransferase [Gulosibacter molinativorax]